MAGRPTKYRKEMCDEIIPLFEQGMSITEVSVNIGISKETFNVWRKENKDFSDAVKRGIEASQAWWESKGRQATFGGVQGFNATSYIFNMKNRFSEDWREKQEIEQTHSFSTVPNFGED